MLIPELKVAPLIFMTATPMRSTIRTLGLSDDPE